MIVHEKVTTSENLKKLRFLKPIKYTFFTVNVTKN